METYCVSCKKKLIQMKIQALQNLKKCINGFIKMLCLWQEKINFH